MPFAPYLANIVPHEFRYPPAFLEIAASSAPNSLYPWWFVDASSQAGELFWKTRRSDGRNLIPFAKTDELDDIACFDGDDHSGDPRVLMIASSDGRNYGFKNFAEWLSNAEKDAAQFGPAPPQNPAVHKHFCKVVAMLDSASVQVTALGADFTRIPAHAVPPDLRRPNAEFWLLRHGELFHVFRNQHDSSLAGSGSWADGGP